MTIAVVTVGAEQKLDAGPISKPADHCVAALPGGGWVVAWTGTSDGSGSGIYQRRFDAGGVSGGLNSLVNGETAQDQATPALAALAGGGWVVTWVSRGEDGSLGGIYQRHYDGAGLASAPVRVNEITAGDQVGPAVAGLPGGGFLVAWQSSDGSGGGIYRRHYGADFMTGGADLPVNTTTSGGQTQARVAALRDDPADPLDGGSVVTWTSTGQDGSEWGVYQRRYDAFGIAGPELQVNTTTLNDQFQSWVTGLADGGWVVTWQSEEADGLASDIHQQRYDRWGGAVGEEIRVNAGTAGIQRAPSVAALADGGWLVTWATTAPGEEPSIVQRRFDGAGGTVGPDLVVNTTTVGTQTAPVVAATPDGGWVVVWTSYKAGTGYALYQRRYAGVAGETLTAGQDVASGTAADEVLAIPSGTLQTGDVLDGGGGTDTIAFSGLLDLTLLGIGIAGFEVLAGGAGADALVVDSAALAAWPALAFRGGAGADSLGSLGGGEVSLVGRDIAGFETVELAAPGGTTLRLDSRKLAMLVAGGPSGSDTLVLEGGAFTTAELPRLFQSGIDTVTDQNGTRSNVAPLSVSLTEASVHELAAAGTVVGTLAGLDPNPGDAVAYALADDAGGRFAIEGGRLVVLNGVALDYEQARQHAVTIRMTDSGGLSTTQSLTIAVANVTPERTAGSARAEVIVGGAGRDTLGGGGGNDRLSGSGERDALRGGSGQDRLDGGLGRDALYGGSGKDAFLFTTKLGRSNVDTLRDFQLNDAIWLENKIFKGIGSGSLSKPKTMLEDAFHLGPTAQDAEDRILYDQATGSLFYDPDGTGPAAALRFAVVATRKALTVHDFYAI